MLSNCFILQAQARKHSAKALQMAATNKTLKNHFIAKKGRQQNAPRSARQKDAKRRLFSDLA
jgi:hypothetical protein